VLFTTEGILTEARKELKNIVINIKKMIDENSGVFDAKKTIILNRLIPKLIQNIDEKISDTNFLKVSDDIISTRNSITTVLQTSQLFTDILSKLKI
jgi:hypothetical protein